MPTFTYRTRMLTRCPDCGAEIRRSGLQERDTEQEDLRP